jgi:hypothetical protein
MRRQLLVGIMTGALCVMLRSQASAFDLTGTWQGKQVCKLLTSDGQRETEVFDPDVLSITQVGDEVRILMPLDTSGPLLYRGLSFTNPTDPNRGEVAFRLCGLSSNTATKGEMGRVKVRVKPALPGGRFEGTSIFSTATEVDTCEWAYQRISVDDPGVPACPPGI